jgi:hypothetical protein
MSMTKPRQRTNGRYTSATETPDSVVISLSRAIVIAGEIAGKIAHAHNHFGLPRPHRRLEHMPPHRRDRSVDRCGKDAIPMVEDEPMRRLRGDDRPKLLDRPLRRGMLRDVPMEDPTRTDLEDDEHKHIEDAEAGGDYREEVTATTACA